MLICLLQLAVIAPLVFSVQAAVVGWTSPILPTLSPSLSCSAAVSCADLPALSAAMLACRTSHRRVGCRTSGRRVEMSAAAAKSPMQSNALVKDLWGVEAIEGPTEAALADPRRVTAVIYDIGGVMKDVLSVSLSKRLAAIPHVGIRCYGQEIGFSTGVEVRSVTVMEEMMKDTPRVHVAPFPSKRVGDLPC